MACNRFNIFAFQNAGIGAEDHVGEHAKQFHALFKGQGLKPAGFGLWRFFTTTVGNCFFHAPILPQT